MDIKNRFLSARGQMSQTEFLISILAIVGFWFVLEKFSAQLILLVAQFSALRVATSFVVYAGPISIVLSAYLVYCLVAKRCHDRNRGAVFVGLFTIALLLPPLLQESRFAAQVLGLGPVWRTLTHEPLVVLGLVVFWFWAAIEMFFLGRRV